MRVAALAFACLTATPAFGQTSPGAAELIAAFPELSFEEETSELVVPDRTIRRETKLPDLEAEYTIRLGRVARAEQGRASRTIQLLQARQRFVEVEAEVRRARDLQRDAQARMDLSDAAPDLLAAAEAGDFQDTAQDDADEAQTALDKALADLAARQADVPLAEEKLRVAKESLRSFAASTAEIENERKEWVSENDRDEAPAYDGAPIERDVVLVQFGDGEDAARIDDVLKRHRLEVRSGIADIRLFITRIIDADPEEPPDVAAARVRRVVANLAREEAVVAASPNLPIGPEIVPDPTNLQLSRVACWDWYGPCSGTMAAKALRLPAAWNFSAAIKRNMHPAVRIAVLDEGFEVHRDLVYDSVCTSTGGTHGNHVMGIIGATWGDGEGIDGGTPFAKLMACSPGKLEAETPRGMTLLLSRVVWTLHRLLAPPSQRPRVVNVSLGYNWVAGFGDGAAPEERLDIRLAVAAQGSFVRALLRLFKDVIVVSSAGNDCGGKCEHTVCAHLAKWSSPFNWAALGDGNRSPNIFVVESLDDASAPSKFSCRNGQIAVPGEYIVSTLTTRTLSEEEALFGLAEYGAGSGTSQAAPGLTAVIGLMLAYNPKLTPAEVRSALQIDTSPRPVADAFEAIIRTAPEQALKDLANLDGTGNVGMADFDIFVKRLREVESLTGPDRDGNNVVDALDFRFPREDLNGDGFLHRSKTSFVPTLGEVTDLEVMQAVWQDTTVDKDTLKDLLDQ